MNRTETEMKTMQSVWPHVCTSARFIYFLSIF